MQIKKNTTFHGLPGMHRPRAASGFTLLAAACALACAGQAAAQAPAQIGLQLQFAEPGGAVPALSEETGTGVVRVIVQFHDAPVVKMRLNVNVQTAERGAMRAHSQRLLALKAPLLQRIGALGGRVQNTTEYVLNAAVVDVPAQRISEIRSMAGVKSVRRAGVYTMTQSAPPSVAELIGTAQLNTAGNTGSGVAIAVIDSGVDYTHASFGGPGTAAYYAAAIAGAGPTTIGDTAGAFPNGPRVKGGYDWLGDTWDNATSFAVTPDPDPIDNKQIASDAAGHGTNSASAAAGGAVPAGGIRAGSAPGAMVLAYRGCSRISSSCEGSALLNSIDSVIQYAAGNPNGGQPGADNPALPPGTRFVINMSLGSNYGNPLIDDLAEASRNAVRAGVTMVTSAGNAGDIPYIVGTPSSADTVISVAASQPALLTGPALAVGAPLNTSYPLGTATFGGVLTVPTLVTFGFAGPNNAVNANTNLACNTSPAVPALAGRAGVADRGACAFTEKALNIQNAGGLLALLINNAPNAGPPGLGGANPAVTIPALSLGTAEGAALKNAMATTPGLQGTVSPLADAANVAAGINQVDLIAGFSSRGPVQNLNALKPDITAPGASIFMANVGTGNQGVNNSGTSFSSPLTAGAAALVLSANPGFAPWQVKAALMNTANPDVFATKTTAGNTLAPLTRMGAGRLQTERAAATGTLAYDSEDVDPTGSLYHNTALSFGPQAFSVAGASSVSRTVVVQNLGTSGKTYNLSVAPRFADDLAKGVAFSTSASSLTVAAGATGTFQLVATATGTQLPTAGGFPSRLVQTDTCTTTADPPMPVAACTDKFTNLEQDGFVTIDGGANDRVSVPYLMYPRQASNVATSRLGTSVITRNTGVGNTIVDVFNLVGLQDTQDQPATVAGSEELSIDIRSVGLRYTPNAVAPPAGVTSGDVMEFAVSLWKPVDTWRVVVFNVEIDTNGDGVTDFTVRNRNTTSNRSAVFISTGVNGAPGNAFFFANAALNSSKIVLPVFPSVMGINANSRIGIRVSSSNGFSATFPFPALDRVPDANAFQYLRPSALVNTPTVRSYVQASNTTSRFSFQTNAANNAASPGDKGLLIFHGDNPVASESTTLQLVP